MHVPNYTNIKYWYYGSQSFILIHLYIYRYQQSCMPAKIVLQIVIDCRNSVKLIAVLKICHCIEGLFILMSAGLTTSNARFCIILIYISSSLIKISTWSRHSVLFALVDLYGFSSREKLIGFVLCTSVDCNGDMYDTINII